MDDTNPPLHEPSQLLLPLAWALALLAGHVVLGFTREARRQSGRPALARDLAAAALALGSGTFATMALIMSSQPLAYTVGYRAEVLAGAWAAAVAIALVPVGLLAWRPTPGSALLGGAAFGVGATAVQAAMLWAAGLLPGLVWRRDTLLAAALLSALAAGAAGWLSLVGPGRAGRYRRRWRGLAAAVLALALTLGPEMVLSAGDMATQITSAHVGGLSSRTLKLLAAVLVPALLVLLAGALHLGRLGRADDDAVPALRPVRRQRQRQRRRPWWAMRP